MGKKKSSNGYGRGTFVDTAMFLSSAWINLGVKKTSPTVSVQSVKVLMMFLGKRQFGNVKDRKGDIVKTRTDDNRFNMPYTELEAHGISKWAAVRCFDELLAKGFIKVVNPGGAYRKDQAVYALTDEWRHWKVGDPPVRTRQKDAVKRGYQSKNVKLDNVISISEKQKSRASTLPIDTCASAPHMA